MAGHKGFPFKSVLAFLPPACLAAFALGIPFPVPRFILPERVFVAYRAGSDGEALRAAAGTRARVALEGRLEAAPRSAAAAEVLAGRLPARPDLEPVFAAAAAAGLPVRIVMDGLPAASDMEAARELYARSGTPVRFVVKRSASSPIAAVSTRLDPTSPSFTATLLLAEEAVRASLIEALVDGKTAWSGPGTALPADRRLDLIVEPTGSGELNRVELRCLYGEGGPASSAFVELARPEAAAERTLLVGGREGARSVPEALFPVRRVAPDGLADADLYAYELVILDGVPLSSLGAEADRRLAEYLSRGAGSVLAAADSPAFGKQGDAPALEALLPVDLFPRAAKNLPDLAMLILIDVSGSMFGDKLSLAKVTGAETLGNLKPDDLVGMMLFSEGAEWLYRFQPAGQTEPSSLLSPVRAGGGTRLFPALSAGLDELEASPRPVRHAVIISDGITEPADFDALIARARRTGITVTTMAVGEAFDRALLTRLSSGTGGRMYRVSDADEVPSLILEDRESVSRTVFSEERADISAVDGASAGYVTGMARFTARPRSLVTFASAAGDPLLSSAQVSGRSALVFASDLYGGFSEGFFADRSALAGFRATLAGLFHESQPGATVAETADCLVVSIRGEGFVAPSLSLADGEGAIVEEAAFRPVLPGHWAAAVSPAAAGPFTALVSDRGMVAARFRAVSNAGLSGFTDGSAAAFDSYRTPWFSLLPGFPSWLLAFFACSLGLTLVLRARR